MRRIITKLFAIALLLAVPAGAQASERDFYRDVQGKWSGNGEIVAGKYKGTRFNCVFDGLQPNSVTGIAIDGNCRIGMFSQPMNASITRVAAGYSGKFMDGAKGDGMDVVGGRYTSSRLVVDIERNDLRGVMVAHLVEDDRMTITVSVRVRDQLIPVIGMSLKRMAAAPDQTITSSVN